MRGLVAIFVVAISVGVSQAQVKQLDTLAMSDDNAPGVPGGGTMLNFSRVDINSSGTVVFNVVLNSTFKDAVYTANRDTGLTLIAAEDAQAGGLPAGVLHASAQFIQPFDELRINDSGDVAFWGYLAGPGVSSQNNRSVFRTSGGGSAVSVLRRGDVLSDGALLNFAEDIRFNDAGHITVSNSVGFPVETVISDSGGSGFVAIARQNDPAPGLVAGTVFSRFATSGVLNNPGQDAFFAFLQGPNIVGSNTAGMFVEDSNGSLQAVAAPGDQAPGLPIGVAYSSLNFGEQQLNDNGQIAVRSRLEGLGIDATNDMAIFIDLDGSGMSVYARSGDQVPNQPAGVAYASVGTVLLNSTGQIAYSASLMGPGIDDSNNGVILFDDGVTGPQIVARQGDQVPGKSAGTVLVSFSRFQLTDLGQVVFYATVLDGAIETDGIYAVESDRIMYPVIVEGDEIDVSSDVSNPDLRTVTFVDANGFTVSNNGFIGFRATYSGNTFSVNVAELTGPPPCVPDTNGDRLLTPADFNAWVVAFNSQSPSCDQNADGLCTPADFNAWVLNFNAGC